MSACGGTLATAQAGQLALGGKLVLSGSTLQMTLGGAARAASRSRAP
jgi:hypothetical protein